MHASSYGRPLPSTNVVSFIGTTAGAQPLQIGPRGCQYSICIGRLGPTHSPCSKNNVVLSSSAILPQHEVNHSWTNGKRIGEADNPGPPKPGRLSGKGLFREFPRGQGYWSSQQLQKMVASRPTFWLQGRRKPGSKPLDRQSEVSRTPPEKRVHQVSKPYSEDGAGPCQGSHHGQCKYSTERASRGPRYDDQTSLNPRTPPQLYARNHSRTADQPTFDYGQPLSYAAAVRGQQSPVSPPESLSRNRRRHPRRFRPFRITIDRYLGAAGS